MGCISNETISPTLWRPLQDDLVTSKGDPTPGDPHELTRRRLGVSEYGLEAGALASILHPLSRALSHVSSRRNGVPGSSFSVPSDTWTEKYPLLAQSFRAFTWLTERPRDRTKVWSPFGVGRVIV